MDKKLKAYIKYIRKEVKNPSTELINYHKMMLAQFQHERLIHLVVTMFFVLFTLILLICTAVAFLALPPVAWGAVLQWTLAGVSLALFITCAFYVRHYYLLENGVQELEETTQKLNVGENGE